MTQTGLIIFQAGRVLCWPDESWRLIGHDEVAMQGWTVRHQVSLTPGDTGVQVWELSDDSVAVGRWAGLRELLVEVTDQDFRVLNQASQVLEWYRNHRFCGRCGTPNQVKSQERAMHCPACGLTQYPRISPCVIMLVTRGDEILLARSKRSTLQLYSCLAGFIEAGETAEEAVHREVMEEVNLRVGNLRYVQSQPWPFPHQLMLGFLADYESGDIQLDPEEIREAGWWRLDQLPPIPPTQTIAGKLIQAYARERGKAW